MFAEDVIRFLGRHSQTLKKGIEKNRKYDRRALLFFVAFSAFLRGTKKQRAASIDFLKCMKCQPGYLEYGESKVLVDLRDQEDTSRFFSDILSYLVVPRKKAMIKQQRFIACVGNIQFRDVEPNNLIVSGLPELFEIVSSKLPHHKVKFCMVSDGNAHDIRSALRTEYKLPCDVFQIVRVPLISKTRIEKLMLSAIQDLIGLDNLIGSLTCRFFSKAILEAFSIVLTAQNRGKPSVMGTSQGLSALFGVAIQKYPRVLTLDDINSIFEVDIK